MVCSSALLPIPPHLDINRRSADSWEILSCCLFHYTTELLLEQVNIRLLWYVHMDRIVYLVYQHPPLTEQLDHRFLADVHGHTLYRVIDSCLLSMVTGEKAAINHTVQCMAVYICK